MFLWPVKALPLMGEEAVASSEFGVQLEREQSWPLAAMCWK